MNCSSVGDLIVQKNRTYWIKMHPYLFEEPCIDCPHEINKYSYFYQETIMKTFTGHITTSAGGDNTPLLWIATSTRFAAHGAQKLFGWFGGCGQGGTGDWMASIGPGPGLLMAALTGSADLA
jgi:hypothetical protein